MKTTKSKNVNKPKKSIMKPKKSGVKKMKPKTMKMKPQPRKMVRFNEVTENPYDKPLPDDLNAVLLSIESTKQKKGLQDRLNQLKLEQKNEDVLAKYIQRRIDDKLISDENLTEEQQKLLDDFKRKEAKKNIDPSLGLDGVNQSIQNFLDTQLVLKRQSKLDKEDRKINKQRQQTPSSSSSVSSAPSASVSRRLDFDRSSLTSSSTGGNESLFSDPMYYISQGMGQSPSARIRRTDYQGSMAPLPSLPASLASLQQQPPTSSTMRQIDSSFDDPLISVAGPSNPRQPSRQSQRSVSTTQSELERMAKKAKEEDDIRIELARLDKEREEIRKLSAIRTSGLFTEVEKGKFRPNAEGKKKGITNYLRGIDKSYEQL